jgi:hypothetical protein
MTATSKGILVSLIANKVVLVKNVTTVSFVSLVYVSVYSAM